MHDEFICSENGTLLLDFLILNYPQRSKSDLRSLLKNDCVEVNGAIQNHPQILLKEKAVVRIFFKKRMPVKGIEIVFEDKDIIVVNKPSGLLSVAKDNDSERNLYGILKHVYFPKKPLVVHRLDKETSGLILFAKTLQAQHHLKKQLEVHTMARSYYGIIEGSFDLESGSWEDYLWEDLRQFVHVTSPTKKDARKAITHYEVFRKKGKYSLVKFFLETGRKHQIRVQSSSRKHPLCGDKKYGSTINPFSRLCLHAFRLDLVHPSTQKEISFEISMPKEFYNYFIPVKERGIICE